MPMGFHVSVPYAPPPQHTIPTVKPLVIRSFQEMFKIYPSSLLSHWVIVLVEVMTTTMLIVLFLLSLDYV